MYDKLVDGIVDTRVRTKSGIVGIPRIEDPPSSPSAKFRADTRDGRAVAHQFAVFVQPLVDRWHRRRPG